MHAHTSGNGAMARARVKSIGTTCTHQPTHTHLHITCSGRAGGEGGARREGLMAAAAAASRAGGIVAISVHARVRDQSAMTRRRRPFAVAYRVFVLVGIFGACWLRWPVRCCWFAGGVVFCVHTADKCVWRSHFLLHTAIHLMPGDSRVRCCCTAELGYIYAGQMKCTS